NSPSQNENMMEGYEDVCAVLLSIHATDPDILKDIDPQRIAAANKAAGVALRKFREYTMNDIVTWSVISIPTRAWAQKIYPEKTADEAVSALWDTIYKMVRVDGE